MLPKVNLDLDPIYPLLNLGHPFSWGRGSKRGMAFVVSSRRGGISWVVPFWSGGV
jgi:hypothetical protein